MRAPDITPWPARDAARYRESGLWEDRALGDYVLEAADARPDKVALVSGDTRMTFRELTARMDEAAERLLSLGIVPGERVLVQLANDWPFMVVTLACFRAGIVPVMAMRHCWPRAINCSVHRARVRSSPLCSRKARPIRRS